MTTLKQVKHKMNVGDRYLFEGRLFRDYKRNTATLYLEIQDSQTLHTTPQIRIGFKQFENLEEQYQSQCVVKSTGKSVSGITAQVFVPEKEIVHYQINVTLRDELYTLDWYPTSEDNENLVASSDAKPIPFEDLFRTPTPATDSTNLRNFLNNLGKDY